MSHLVATVSVFLTVGLSGVVELRQACFWQKNESGVFHPEIPPGVEAWATRKAHGQNCTDRGHLLGFNLDARHGWTSSFFLPKAIRCILISSSVIFANLTFHGSGCGALYMAKKDQEKPSGIGRVKFRYADRERYFDLDVDGIKHESGVVDGLKSIANALAGRTIASTGGRGLPAKPASTGAVVTPPPQEDGLNEEQPFEEEADTATTTEGDDNAAQRPRKKYVPKAPTLLSDLDLSSGQISLQNFANEKNPTELSDKYLVVATWFKEQMKMDEINIDHIFTAFRTLDWKMPDDPGSIFRALKHKKQYFDKGEGTGGYKVTFLATNYVANMGSKE